MTTISACLAMAATMFSLQKDDVFVMAGDSITFQHLHSKYIEAYFLTRFPELNLKFRNSGVDGNRAPHLLERIDWDVFCWKPTIVSIELGMNDFNSPIETYIGALSQSLDRIEKFGARPILITASPVNDGTTMATKKKANTALEKLASELGKLAEERRVTLLDQFHPLIDLWGTNKNSPNAIPIGGDEIHPGPVGQLTMAYEILCALDAPALVSSATIDVAARKVAAEKCKITDLNFGKESLSFIREDECIPMPIHDDSRDALNLVPFTERFNRYTLKITGLAAGTYQVQIDGVRVAAAPAEELAAGINLAGTTKGPIREQGRELYKLIEAKDELVTKYRWVASFKAPKWLRDSTPDVGQKQKAEMDRLMKLIDAASDKINAAAKPQPHKFEVKRLN